MTELVFIKAYASRFEAEQAQQYLGQVGIEAGDFVICGDKVVVGSSDGRLYMIRLSDGRKIWSYEIGSAIVSSPAVVKNRLILHEPLAEVVSR